MFSVFKGGLNDHFKFCFLVATIFTSTLVMEYSTNLPDIALFLNLAFYFLIKLPFFYTSLHKCWIRYMILNMVLFLNSNIL